MTRNRTRNPPRLLLSVIGRRRDGEEEGVAGNLHAECGKRSKVCVKMLQNWSRTRDAPLSLPSLSHTLVAWSRSRFPSLQRAPCARSASDADCDCDVSVAVVFIYFCFFLRLQNFFTFGFGFSTLLRRLRSRRGDGADDDDDDDDDGDGDDDAGYYLYELALSSERQHFQSESDKQRTPNRAVRSARSVAKISVIRVFSSSSSSFFFLFIFVASSRNCASISIITDKPIDRQSATANRSYCSCFFLLCHENRSKSID